MPVPVTVYGEVALHVVSTAAPVPGLALGPIELAVGGPAGAVAVQLARLGHPPRLVGIRGDDAPGRYVEDMLRRAGVDCASLSAVGRTPRVVAVVGDGSVRLAADPGAPWSASPWVTDPPEPSGATAYITGFPDQLPTIREFARRGVRLLVDVGFVPLLARPDDLLAHVAAVAPATDVCVVSGAQLAGPVRRRVAAICVDAGVRTVLTTLAGDGVLVTTGDGTEHLPAHPVDVVDPLCAGDAFVAGFLCGRQEGRDDLEAARFGQAVAATKVGMLGRFPTRAEVDRLREPAAR